jgi:hypothetical protein
MQDNLPCCARRGQSRCRLCERAIRDSNDQAWSPFGDFPNLYGCHAFADELGGGAGMKRITACDVRNWLSTFAQQSA